MSPKASPTAAAGTAAQTSAQAPTPTKKQAQTRAQTRSSSEAQNTPSGAPRKRKSPSPSPSVGSNASSTGKKRKGSPSSETGTPKSTSRGLRHFSLMVCRKVEEKGTTSHNEVADELVKEVLAERRKENPDSVGSFDEKNVRRRVYDALNVLMALDIISKDKKAIQWKGLPESCHRDMLALQKERDYREQQVMRKRQALQELLVQQVCFRNLVARNQPMGIAKDRIPLPFIVVNTHPDAIIQCNMNSDRTDVLFNFSTSFEINDDNTILKKMGMAKTDMNVLQQMLPEDLLEYGQRHGMLDEMVHPDKENQHPASASQAQTQGQALAQSHLQQQQQQQQFHHHQPQSQQHQSAPYSRRYPSPTSSPRARSPHAMYRDDPYYALAPPGHPHGHSQMHPAGAPYEPHHAHSQQQKQESQQQHRQPDQILPPPQYHLHPIHDHSRVEVSYERMPV